LLLAVAYSRREVPQPAQVTRSSLLPPPNFAFAPYNFAVSPDGTRLAFVAVGPDGKDTLWQSTITEDSSPNGHGRIPEVDDASGRFQCENPVLDPLRHSI
jgi:hypothetical protein